jgi:general secretion pathway protein I
MTSYRSAGFTLIEVMVALAIVAITLGAGIKAAGALTTNTQRLVDVTAAQWCADNQLANLRMANLTPAIGTGEFSCTQLGQTYPGRLVVKLPPNPNLRVVDAQVLDAANQPILVLSTVMRK